MMSEGAVTEVRVVQRPGAVALLFMQDGQHHHTEVELDGKTARALGDELFRAGCSVDPG